MSESENIRRAIRAHIANIMKWDIASVVNDYASDAVIVLPNGSIKGHDGIAAMFAQSPRVTGLIIDAESYVGPIALITYHADGFSFAADTFIVRDELIAVQTIAIHQ